MEDSNLSKSQRKKFKKERKRLDKERARNERLRKQRNTKIRNYGIALLIIIGIAVFIFWRSIPPKNGPIIQVQSSYDFGTVSQANGVVSGTVSITNAGNEDLILNNMETSCGCTSASVIYNGVEGPAFGMSMHGTNPRNWRQVIPPGESAELKISYDPNVHKDLTGQVIRVVFIYSNDPRNGKETVTIRASQTA